MGQTIDFNTNIVERCQEGDKLAQREIYNRYCKGMYHVSLRIVNQKEDAEDILQESFVSAFQNIHKLQNAATFGSWMKRIVINKSLNWIKSKNVKMMNMTENKDISDQEEKYLSAEEIADNADLEATIWSQFSVEDVKSAIGKLSDGYRVVFNLFMFENLSHKEIAQALNITESTSKSQLNRAKKRIKETLTVQGAWKIN